MLAMPQHPADSSNQLEPAVSNNFNLSNPSLNKE
jgi:hypothetical protein